MEQVHVKETINGKPKMRHILTIAGGETVPGGMVRRLADRLRYNYGGRTEIGIGKWRIPGTPEMEQTTTLVHKLKNEDPWLEMETAEGNTVIKAAANVFENIESEKALSMVVGAMAGIVNRSGRPVDVYYHEPIPAAFSPRLNSRGSARIFTSLPLHLTGWLDVGVKNNEWYFDDFNRGDKTYRQKGVIKQMHEMVVGSPVNFDCRLDESVMIEVLSMLGHLPYATDAKLSDAINQLIVDPAARRSCIPAEIEKQRVLLARYQLGVDTSLPPRDIKSSLHEIAHRAQIMAKDAGSETKWMNFLINKATETAARVDKADPLYAYVAFENITLNPHDDSVSSQNVCRLLKDACRAGCYQRAVEALASTGLDLTQGVAKHSQNAIFATKTKTVEDRAMKRMLENKQARQQ